MKTTYWMHRFQLFIGCSIIGVSAFTFTILGVILTIKDVEYVGCLMMGLLFLCFLFYALFINKNTLSKISFGYDGISVSWLNQHITFIPWIDVENIKAVPISSTAVNLCLVAKNEEVEIEPTKNIYNAIMHFCPIQSIKNKINSIESFKWLHKNNKK